MRDFIAIISFIPLLNGAKFKFLPSNSMNLASSWGSSSMPCQEDRVRFDRDSEVVTVLSGSILTSEFYLPDDGIIYFDKKSQLGVGDSWQCDKRDDPEGEFSQN